ncbi:MAG: hypothetical protein OXG72_07865 [Acidobacteria bacterium]|nr:hypothetical protein [Acidobacteriota bacterium]
MTLTLSNVSDAVIDDEAIGTITITNTDPMPKAWMVQFRRTVGSPVVTTPLPHDSKGGGRRTSPLAASRSAATRERELGSDVKRIALV